MLQKSTGLLLGFFFSVAFPIIGQEKSNDIARPNVILIMADDLGWGDTGYYGHPILKTPSLDQMAAQGMRFDRFYAAAPVCSPTRGSVVTGRHPYRYGVTFANQGQMKPQELTLAEVLLRHGYQTGHFGKWHLGTLTNDIKESNRGGRSPKHYSPPWDNGFETCFSTEAKTPTWWNEGDYEKYGTHYWTGPGEMVSERRVIGDDSKVIMDAAIPFIEKAAAKDQNFFSVIWFHTPHKPIVAGPKYLAMYENSIPDAERDQKENAAHYYGCVTAMDEQIGRLRKRLEELGVAENTMIWFCSDNGPENKTAGRAAADLDGPEGEPAIQLRARKRSLYEGGIRVPGLLVWPGKVQSGSQTSVPCVTSDFLPTVLKAASIEMPLKHTPLDGIDLLPILNGEKTRRGVPIGFQSGKQAVWMGDDYKVIRAGKEDGWQLFNIEQDPGEKNPLDNPETKARMVAQFGNWRKSVENSAAGEDYKAIQSQEQR